MAGRERAPLLYGPDGRPLRRRELTRERARPSLYGVRQVWRGETIASGLTPQRLTSVFRQADDGNPDEFLTLAEEMEERDPHYFSVLGTRKRAVSGLDVTVEAASDGRRETELADAVRDLVRRPGFTDLLEDCLDGLGKGYAVVEILWDRSGPRWTPERYVWRDPRFFRPDREDGRTLRLLDEADPIWGVELPPAKFICHVPRLKSGLPVRGGLARVAAIAWMCKAYAVTDWVGYAEVYGQPWRVARYGPDATEKDIDNLIVAVSNLGTDASAVMADSMKIDMVSPSGGTDDGSSRAQAEVHDRVRGDLRRADARQLAETLNRDLVRPFIDLNWGPQAAYPRLALPVPDPGRTARLLAAVKDLVPLGLRVEQSVIRQSLALPDPASGADLLQAPSGAARSAQTELLEAMNPAQRRELVRALHRQRGSEEDEVGRLADAALEDWRPVLDPVLDPVRALAREADGEQDFLAELSDLLQEMDPAELVRSLATAAFQARGLGDATDKD